MLRAGCFRWRDENDSSCFVLSSVSSSKPSFDAELCSVMFPVIEQSYASKDGFKPDTQLETIMSATIVAFMNEVNASFALVLF